jgi:methylated-DNA-protein-cysteine methyltransferase-like protein
VRAAIQQRVIASNGYISPRGDGSLGAARQMERLREEGVEVVDMGGNGVVVNGRGGRYRVSIAQFGWFPEELP